MDTIKELYYGNINPCERDVEPDQARKADSQA